MLAKIRVLTITITSGGLLLLVLCLGAQNFNDRKSINLGLTSTFPLSTGFISGASIILGVISGGTIKAFSLSNKEEQETTL